jgi:hypothetical protein
MSLPLRQRLALSAPVDEVDGGNSDIGGMTVKRKGEGRVCCDVDDPRFGVRERGGDPVDNVMVGIEGTSIPNDWAIRPNCLGDNGFVGGRYLLSSCSSAVSSVSSIASAFPFPLASALILTWGPNLSVEILRDGKSKDSNVPVAGVTSGVLQGVGLAGHAKSGEVMAGAVEPLTAMMRS